MSWMQSLIKLADLEVETLQKRLREIADRRAALERTLTRLEQEARAETDHAANDAQAGWCMSAFRDALKQRRAKAQAESHACALEEQGARDALGRAFESQKKYETLAESARVAAVRQADKREIAALDELALRRTGT